MPRPIRFTSATLLLAASLLALPMQAEQIRGPQGRLGAPLKAPERTAPPGKPPAPAPAPANVPDRPGQAQTLVDGEADMPALMAGSWRTVDGAEMLRLYRQLGKEAHGLLSEPLAQAMQFRVLPLPFYDQTSLLEVRARGDQGQLILAHVLLTPKGNPVLNGTSPVIHELNATGLLHLDSAEQAAAYLRFFCGAVVGTEGPFTIIERADQVWLAPDASPALRGQIAAKLSPPHFTPDPKGGWRAQAVVSYSDALFVADFHIQLNGVVEMLNDTPIMAELPVRRIGYKDYVRQEICTGKPCPRLPA